MQCFFFVLFGYGTDILNHMEKCSKVGVTEFPKWVILACCKVVASQHDCIISSHHC